MRCHGEAHQNPRIDNCPVCMPYGWGWIPSPPPDPRNAGLLLTKMRSGGEWVSVYESKAAGIDGEKYATVCEVHGTMICSKTKKLAVLAMQETSDWCEACRQEASQ